MNKLSAGWPKIVPAQIAAPLVGDLPKLLMQARKR